MLARRLASRYDPTRYRMWTLHHVAVADSVQAELLSLNGVTQDSTKLLSEKLALSRELALLTPEVEHLRSQLAHHKEVLGEKLALERQLSTLEVELANERRAVQRALQKQTAQDAETESDLRQQVQDLERKVEKQCQEIDRSRARAELQDETEAKLRQQVDKLEKELTAARSSRSDRQQEEESRRKFGDLEKKLATHDKKISDELELVLRQRDELEAQLAEAQRELQAKAAKKEPPGKKQKSEGVAKKTAARSLASRKRRANEITEEEPVLRTPTASESRLKRPIKKRGLDHTLVGEKSNFSITPFLNKTMSFADTSIEFTAGLGLKSVMDMEKTSSASELDTSGDSAVVEAPASAGQTVRKLQLTKTTKVPLKDAKPRGGLATSAVLGDAAPSKKNQKTPASAHRKAARSEPTLDRVMEETEDAEDPSTEQENQSADNTASYRPTQRTGDTSLSSVGTEPKKKKRKLGAGGPKTLFDGDGEDDAEAVPVPARKRGKTAGSARGAGKRAVGLVRTAFAGASFSPLKRDKRGVTASFLA